MTTKFINDPEIKNVNAESARKRSIQIAAMKVSGKTKTTKPAKIQPRRWDDHGLCD
jgi:hypothetical protein